MTERSSSRVVAVAGSAKLDRAREPSSNAPARLALTDNLRPTVGLVARTNGASDRRAPRPLRTNFIWTLGGNVVYAGCQWGMLIALAKLGDTTMVGQFSMALAICAPVFMLTNLDLRGVQATDARTEYAFWDYISLRLITTLLALGAITFLAFGTDYAGPMTAVILLVGLAKAFESLSDIFYGRLQQREEMERIACSMILRGVLALVALTTAMLLTGSLITALMALAGTWCFVLVAYDLRLPRHASGAVLGWQPRNIARLAWLALPLGIVLALISLNTNLPRYFVQQSLGLAEVGVFSALGYFSAAGGVVAVALGQAAAPRLSQKFAAGDRRAYCLLVIKLIALALLLGSCGVGLAWIAGPLLLNLVYRPEYVEHVDVFIWLMVAAGPGYAASFLGYAMTAARAFHVQPPLTLATTIVTAVACCLLIPRNGLAGGAQAMLIASCFQMLAAGALVGMLCRRSAERPL